MLSELDVRLASSADAFLSATNLLFIRDEESSSTSTCTATSAVLLTLFPGDDFSALFPLRGDDLAASGFYGPDLFESSLGPPSLPGFSYHLPPRLLAQLGCPPHLAGPLVS